MHMNLNNGDGDVPALASLNESEDITPCIVHQKKKGMCRRKERKMLHMVCSKKKGECRTKVRESNE